MKKLGTRWTVFSGRPNRANFVGPRVTLSPKMVLLFNKHAYEALGGPTAVELRFDEGSRTIGVLPVDIRCKNAFLLKSKAAGNKKYSYRVIHASAFCKHFGITPSRTILFTDIEIDHEGTMTLEMSTAVVTGRGLKR